MKYAIMILSVLLLSACGEGFWERQTSIGGVAVIDSPKGLPVTCFVDADYGGIDCLTHKEIREGR